MGSNNSKNGMSEAEAMSVGNNLVREATYRLRVDPTRITLCGFSGGAKVALLTGAANPMVSAVVYCGAAIPVQPAHELRMLGFAGTRDMNYTDVVSFHRQPVANIEKEIIQWNGKHEFPVPGVFDDAFTWLNTGTFPAKPRKQITVTDAEMATEQKQKQLYIAALQDPDPQWWKNEVNRLNLGAGSSLMNERLLGFISLACYSLSVHALQENNLVYADRILNIYRMADPLNKACTELQNELDRKKKQGKN
jgi:pimeloyl-ACP methyl ester carboxylesterase